MAITERQTKPVWADAADDSLDYIRERLTWTLCTMVCNGLVIIPGWTSTPYSTSSPQDFRKPDYWLLTCDGDTREIRIDLTYTADDVTEIIIKYNDGVSSPGMTTLTDGTVTITRDGDGNITGITTA